MPGPRPVRLEAFATGSDEADWIAAEIGRRMAAGTAPRDHAILVRANGHADAYPARPQRGRHPVALLRDVRPVCPARRSGCCSRSCVSSPTRTSSVDLYALAASEVYGLDGEDLTAIVNLAQAPAPVGVGDPGRARGAARDPPPATRDASDDRTRSSPTWRGDVALAHERPAGELLYGFLRRTGHPGAARRDGLGRRRGGAFEHRALLRDRPGPVSAARRRSRDLPRAAPRRR